MMTVMITKMMTNDLAHKIGLIETAYDPEYLQKEDELVAKYGSWAVGRAKSMCPIGDVVNIERIAKRLAAKAIK